MLPSKTLVRIYIYEATGIYKYIISNFSKFKPYYYTGRPVINFKHKYQQIATNA
jgi:hypothetical protein